MNLQKTDIAKIDELITDAGHIVIIQADNPDGDSLGTSLALEQLLGESGKEVTMYCAVDVPSYLRYLSGWDRVTNELPKQFDLSIVVDASSSALLQKLFETGKDKQIRKQPCIVLDHHETVEEPLEFATVLINEPSLSSTAELVYTIAKAIGLEVDETAGLFIMTAILGDTQGLSNSLASAQTYRVMAELVDIGVDRPGLEDLRREYSKMPPEIFKYKARLIDRSEFHIDGQLAVVTVPQQEITEFSAAYNPAPLIQTDLLQTAGVGIAIVLKHYDNNKILAAIRCNQGFGFGAKLAEHFGGGGHDYAAGFKIQDGRSVDEIKTECIKVVHEHILKRDTTSQDKS
ncbi:MAG: DHH family phosphoesterase [Candidatus Saccharibacteria bacterium]|nr:DHH family phosphoesterase [Candidatus Saccharibacteria bacterium]